MHFSGSFYVVLVLNRGNQGTSKCLKEITDWCDVGLPVRFSTDGTEIKITLQKSGKQTYRGYAIGYIAYSKCICKISFVE